MNFLLDTHAFLWAVGDPGKLSKTAQLAIRNPRHAVFVSGVSAVEIAVKRALGKLEAPASLVREIELRGFQELPLRYKHGETMEKLPGFHADPFDRMLIAQAISENLTIITRDAKIDRYPVRTCW